MTTWYVTTGVSLWEQSRCWKLDGVEEELLCAADSESVSDLQKQEHGRRLLELWSQKRKELKDALASNPYDPARRAAQLVEENFRRECWSRDRLRTLPAELTTLYLLLHRQDEHRTADEDNIVFLVGDSNREVGYVLEAILQAVGCPNPTQVRECGRLDPIDDRAFNSAMQGLAELIGKAAGDLRLVLTGGYKGVLIGLARRFPDASVYYTHERSATVLICFRGREAVKVDPPID